jgi:hypothetical protein
VLTAVPPDLTDCVLNSSLMMVPLATPPDRMSCSLLLLSRVPTAMPPDETSSRPNVSAIVLLAVPSTCCTEWDPKTVKPSSLVPLAVPPAETVIVPPLTVAPRTMPLARTVSPPLLVISALLSTPPEETFTVPASKVAIVVPPDSTLRVPPLSTARPLLVWPAETLSVPPLPTPGPTMISVPPALSASSRNTSPEKFRPGSRSRWNVVPFSTICSTLPESSCTLPALSKFTDRSAIVSPRAKPLITLAGKDVLSISSVPPELANVMAPLTTAPAVSSSTPPLMIVPLGSHPTAHSQGRRC